MTGILVVIASPGDTADERAAVRDQMNDWNINNGRRQGIALLPWLYERSAVPALGSRPQSVINSQAVDRADVVVAFFDSRLGSSTGVDVSGTAEEIRRAHSLGKPVHVYFSNEPIPRDADLEQAAALSEFRRELEAEGLLGDYDDPADLAGQVIRALEHDIDEAGWSGVDVSATSSAGARLKWEHDHRTEQQGLDKNGKMKYRTLSNRLVVTNSGDRAAEDLRFKVTGLDGAQLHFDPPREAVTIEPDSVRDWVAIPVKSGSVQIDAEWTEGGAPQERRWTIRI
ncbi:MAG TPA: hypothetical protein PK331_05355 [Gordonia sp. (in: high G+C Gram-positive bacteria)]|nr:hypothetical protein [Gordonia sp. (in: high G+C Gram-positive bacteria)]RUP38607.1 MAG: DUF4062 domain-containing protein [Gordonia sp. (in: high G+C Gram-positive bacteria)]HRC50336.1 hypothetical protein [Gordonia sp. (in: high G+C Gram-positive bacteria)]